MFLTVTSLEERVNADEITAAIMGVQDKELEDVVEALAPIVEQETELDAAEHLSYAIQISEYDSVEFTTSSKSYYDVMDGDDEYVGASATTVVEKYEHELLVTAQEVATNIRQGDATNKAYTFSDFDVREKHAKESIKTFSPAMWQMMYDGKITFN